MSKSDKNVFPAFTDDERAFLRLLKATYPWARWICRSAAGLSVRSEKPRVTPEGGMVSDGYYLPLPAELLPAIKSGTLVRLDFEQEEEKNPFYPHITPGTRVYIVTDNPSHKVMPADVLSCYTEFRVDSKGRGRVTATEYVVRCYQRSTFSLSVRPERVFTDPIAAECFARILIMRDTGNRDLL